MHNDLTKTYVPKSAFDEFLNQDHPRTHWQSFIKELNKISPEILERSVQDIRRNLKDNGVTYNLHTDSTRQRRDWYLDILPNIISEAEWGMIEIAIEQRAQLFKLILDDCYGEQTLIKRGLLPAEIIFGHKGYLLPAHGIQPNLSLFATDLARGVNGDLWVVSDRTQVPSGMGYALENRTVLRNVLPQLFKSEKVTSLANFFRSLQESLSNLSPRYGAEANIVLLSPGTNSETYFEHAYLASYLGYTLVQGDDLAVRNGKVFLKTLKGLEQIDVIIRRVDDDCADTLELRGDTRLGTPGLLEAVRRGNVVIANSIGSSLLENPGLLPFLPEIAKHLLGEELRLASVATWWCGQPKECKYVLSKLDTLVIKRIDRKNKTQTVFGNTLLKEQLQSLKAQIEAEPYLYVGQQLLEHATSPVLTNNGSSMRLEPRHTLLRCFAALNTDSYTVMPGGLSRSSVEQGNMIISNRMGGTSKDTWVLKNRVEPHKSLWNTDFAANQTVGKALQAFTLTSRTADNLFWVGRYAERSEAIARFLRIIVELLRNKEADPDAEKVLIKLIVSLLYFLQNDQNIPKKVVTDIEFNMESELLTLNLDSQKVGGLHNTICSMLNAATETKSAWSTDSWRVLTSIQDLWENIEQQNDISVLDLITPLNSSITSLMAFSGLNSESMNHSINWRFLDIGRRVERAKLIALLVKTSLSEKLEEQHTNYILEQILTVSENIISYRRNYRSFLDFRYALELLLFDENNPRALAFQLLKLEEHLQYIPQSNQHYPLSETAKAILKARTSLRLVDISHLDDTRKVNNSLLRYNLQALLNQQIELLDNFAILLGKQYFSHTIPSRQLLSSIESTTEPKPSSE